jgi:hypothetical protein
VAAHYSLQPSEKALVLPIAKCSAAPLDSKQKGLEIRVNEEARSMKVYEVEYRAVVTLAEVDMEKAALHGAALIKDNPHLVYVIAVHERNSDQNAKQLNNLLLGDSAENAHPVDELELRIGEPAPAVFLDHAIPQSRD